jgi:ribosome-associated protein
VDDELRTPHGLVLPASCITWRATPSGGPGGQHANTSDTRVELTADLAGLRGPGSVRARNMLGDTVTVVAADTRSQWRNRAIARQRLAERLDIAGRPVRPRRATRPSRGAVQARLDDKRRRSARKSDRAWRPEE